MLTATARFVGRSTLNMLGDTGAIWRLALAATAGASDADSPVANVFALRATIEQIVRAGYSSLPLVMLICFLVGMIMALQSAYQLQRARRAGARAQPGGDLDHARAGARCWRRSSWPAASARPSPPNWAR